MSRYRRPNLALEEFIMPCYSAIDRKNVTASANDTVENVLRTMDKEGVKTAAIFDNEGDFIGIFSKNILLKNLIPVSVVTSGDVQIDMKIEAAPGIAKRLNKVMPLPVYDLMERKPTKVRLDDPIWEGVSQLTKRGEPLCVVDEKGKYHGMITYESLVNDLQNMDTSDS